MKPSSRKSHAAPQTAMVLAAGLGLRMRPITNTIPKPLVSVAGKTLLDWGLDTLAASGVRKAVVNVHYFPEQIVAHVKSRSVPVISISDESDGLLDSAGGIVKALPLLGADPFFILNADTFWIDAGRANLDRLADAWRPGEMDALLLLADMASATGHSGSTDFLVDGDGRLTRADRDPTGLIYAGVAICDPTIFAGAKPEKHSLNLYFDRAISSGRLYGLTMQGKWITVGTPEAIPLGEASVRAASRPPA